MFSRKMIIALVGLGLVLVGYALTAFFPILASQFTVFVGAISGILALFMASNVSSQLVERKGATEVHVAKVNAGLSIEPVEQVKPMADL